MLIITDCGCTEHESYQVTFDGVQAAMMEHFVTNLPIYGLNYSYICEYGHTHRVIPNFSQEEMAAVENAGLAREAGPVHLF